MGNSRNHFVLIVFLLFLTILNIPGISYSGLNEDLLDAAGNGNLLEVKNLLDKGADVNAKSTKSGGTALFYASVSGHTAVVKTLLEKGANVNAKAVDDVTALIIATSKGYAEIVKILLDGSADVNAKTTFGMTALKAAAQEGYIDIVKLLISKEVEVNTKDNDGATALMYAIQKGSPEIAQALLAKGADINIKANNGMTALMIGALYDRADIIKELIIKGAHVNEQNNFGFTALIIAAQHGFTESVKALMANGVDVNLKTNKGKTALMLAKEEGHTQIVDLIEGRESGKESGLTTFDQDFKKADTLEQIETLLKKYPNEGEKIIHKLEVVIIDEIKRKGVGSRFIVKEYMPRPDKSGSITLMEEPEHIRFLPEFPGDMKELFFDGKTGMFSPPSGYDSVHRFVGKIEFKIGNVYAFIGEGDKLNRLTFALIQNIGYIYVRGKGKAILKEGTEIKFGY